LGPYTVERHNSLLADRKFLIRANLRGVKAPPLVFGPVLAVGLVGSAVSMNGRGAEPQFAYGQLHPTVVGAGPLARAVGQGREPLASGRGQPGLRATCRPGSGGQLRNRWICRVVYPSGHQIRYALRVNADGTFHGTDNHRNTIDGHVRSLSATGG
jgi:hypothetical protein